MQKELVLFLSPDLHETVQRALDGCSGWHYTIYSTGPDRQQNLCDVRGLTELLKGADACFIATYTDFSKDVTVEVAEGMAIGQACKKASVKNIVLSAHLSCERTIGIPAKHYDSKSEIYAYMRHTLELPVTMVNIPPTYELFYNFLCPTPTSDGSFQLVFPTVGPASIDFIATEDIGSCLLPLLQHPEVFSGKTVALCGDKLVGRMIVTVLNAELSPMFFRQRQVTIQAVRDRPVVGAIDMANMFEFLGRSDLKCCISGTKELYPMVKSFRHWVSENKERLAEASINNIQAEDNMAALI